MENLITDRTIMDYLHFVELREKGYAAMTEAERAEWDAGNMKGAYNVSDLNRVGKALNYVRDRLHLAGYVGKKAFTAKEDWGLNDVPTAADLAYYLAAVKVIHDAMAFYRATPPPPNFSGALDYNEANNIEKILIDVDELITKMLAARHFSGELYSGEV